MILKIVEFSLRQRVSILLATTFLIGFGIWSALRLPIDAVPDITNPQVLVNTPVSALAPEEIEKLVTIPLESELAGVPGMIEMRSLSKFGLSQIRMTFADGIDLYRTRQLVSERLATLGETLPPGFQPQLAPVSTALGEIFYYAVEFKPGAEKPASQLEQLQLLRQAQEYLISPLLRATPGLAEVNTSGGFERQFVVMPDPARLASVGLTLEELAAKINENTQNAGGGFVEIGGEQVVIRANTRIQSAKEIAAIPLKFAAGPKPLLVSDVAEVAIGSSLRTGAATVNGEEGVIGGALMLAGANSRVVARDVAARLEVIQTKLPPGLEIRPLYNRAGLVNRTLQTVRSNLFEGALLVVAVLFALLGNLRAAFIVALAIPLSMLFALIGMVQTRVSGNLMSLGAIDFGLIIDGSVVMVENILRHLARKQKELGRPLLAGERFEEVLFSAKEIASPMFFGVLIITVVYIPILALTGIEGKMFRPMALTVMFALGGSLALALTLMPVLSSWLLTGKIREADNWLVRFFKALYAPLLRWALRFKLVVVAAALSLFVASVFVFNRLGAEFIPQLDEGTMLLQFIRSSSAGLDASTGLQRQSEKRLREEFPEVERIFALIGTAEIAVDPMGPNVADSYLELKPRRQWRQVDGRIPTKEELIERMRRHLAIHAPGQTFLFTQPIQMRFNEMMAGVRADLAVKIFGDDFAELERIATEIRDLLRAIPGGGDVEFEAFGRSPLLEIKPDRETLRRFNVQAANLNETIATALAGREVGAIVEGNRRYPIIVRAREEVRASMEAMKRLPVRAEEGGLLYLGQLASFDLDDAVAAITREAGQRRAAVLVNLRGRDVEGFVREALGRIQAQIKFPPGYYFEFGGQFENLQKARARLAIIVPLALLVIFVLILMSFGSFKQAALIFVSVPLAVTGGVFALWVRNMPFTISAGVGFIALSGIAVLNGIMLVSFINQLRREGASLREAITEGTLTRLRPKLMTALVASLGFVPMAIATGAGGEVQRPLATVVIGGIITSTFLTLIVLPVLYEWLEKNRRGAESQPQTR